VPTDAAEVRMTTLAYRTCPLCEAMYVNSNLLTDPGPLDPLSGTARLNGIPVTVAPI
jgi:hypothetical protein